MRQTHKALGIAVLAMLIAGLAIAPSNASAGRPKLAITDGDFGRHLTNGKGRALYVFTSDSGKTSNCYDDCARAWPPYIVGARPRAVEGARQGLVGVTRRTDGRLQATYAGHPVYFYVGDNSPGEVLCQAVNEFGGLWYILRAGGKIVRQRAYSLTRFAASMSRVTPRKSRTSGERSTTSR